MQIRIAGIKTESVVDGEGIRSVVYFQGCPHGCEGCHNPDTHDFAGGSLIDSEQLLQDLFAGTLASGITLSGGEPFAQPAAARLLAKGAKERGKNVWVYTGYRLEELLLRAEWRAVLAYVDVLVDGLFLQEERDLSIPYRGSRNQRLLDRNAWSNFL